MRLSWPKSAPVAGRPGSPHPPMSLSTAALRRCSALRNSPRSDRGTRNICCGSTRDPDISAPRSHWRFVRSITRPRTSTSWRSWTAKAFAGRAYLTLVADVATRSILGCRLTLEKPSALSVALCLAEAMCPKENWLAARGIEHRWPMFGRPRLLVANSAKEFKGHAFERGREDYGIRIRCRNRGRVHEGGVVERLLGKLNAVLAMHPGSTGRSVADRDGYPAQRRARLSFADLERCVALAVIDHNLQQNAKTLKTPAAEWAHCSGDLPRLEDDAARVVLAFLPGAERRLSPQGVSLFALDYYSRWLGWPGPAARPFGSTRGAIRPPRYQPHLCPGSGNEGVPVRRATRWAA